jgi:hypothetical protein
MFRPPQPQGGGAGEEGLAAQAMPVRCVTDVASTFTRTSLASGAGLSTCAIRSVSGGPYFS